MNYGAVNYGAGSFGTLQVPCDRATTDFRWTMRIPTKMIGAMSRWADRAMSTCPGVVAGGGWISSEPRELWAITQGDTETGAQRPDMECFEQQWVRFNVRITFQYQQNGIPKIRTPESRIVAL